MSIKSNYHCGWLESTFFPLCHSSMCAYMWTSLVNSYVAQDYHLASGCSKSVPGRRHFIDILFWFMKPQQVGDNQMLRFSHNSTVCWKRVC